MSKTFTDRARTHFTLGKKLVSIQREIVTTRCILLKITWKVLWWIYPQYLKICSFRRHSILIDWFTCSANQNIYKIYCLHFYREISFYLLLVSNSFSLAVCTSIKVLYTRRWLGWHTEDSNNNVPIYINKFLLS